VRWAGNVTRTGEERVHTEKHNRGIDEYDRITLIWIVKECDAGFCDWIHLAHYGNRRWDVVNMVTDRWVA
jgi:hypothetical protein